MFFCCFFFSPRWQNPHSQSFSVSSHPSVGGRFQGIVASGCPPQNPQLQQHNTPQQHQQQTAQQRAATFASLFQSLAPSQQQHRNSLAVIGSPQLGGISEFMAKRPSLQDPLLMEVSISIVSEFFINLVPLVHFVHLYSLKVHFAVCASAV